MSNIHGKSPDGDNPMFERRSGNERRDDSGRREGDRRKRSFFHFFERRKKESNRRSTYDRRFGIDRRTRMSLGIKRPGE